MEVFASNLENASKPCSADEHVFLVKFQERSFDWDAPSIQYVFGIRS